MNDAERISTLEKEVAQLRERFAEYGRSIQLLGGQSRAFESATIALIASHPRPDLLGPVLRQHLANLEAGVVAVSETEEHLQGVQAAQNVLMFALGEAVGRASILAKDQQ